MALGGAALDPVVPEPGREGGGGGPPHFGLRWFFGQWWREHAGRRHWLNGQCRRVGLCLSSWPERPAHPVLRWLDASVPVFVGVILLSLVFQHLSLFGLEQATQAQSGRVGQRLMAPFHPPGGQDAIAVVLIDEATLQARQTGWPPQYSYYADMLRGVLEQQPRAVFLDIMIEQERHYDGSLAGAREAIAQMLAEHPVPVYFALSHPGARSLFADVPGVREAVVGWQGHGKAYPLQVGGEHAYAGGGRDSGAASAGKQADTAALALYREVCASDRRCPARDSLLGTARLAPMHVAWGSLPAREPGGWGDEQVRALFGESQCLRGQPAGLGTRLRQALSLGWDSLRSGLMPRLEDDNRQRCPYFLTLGEEQLSELLPASELPLGTRGPLEDRVVFIGTQLSGINDWVDSPVHQRLPGVYLHAMALDNLLVWGGRYLRHGSQAEALLPWLHGALLSLLGGGLLVWHSQRAAQGRSLVPILGALALAIVLTAVLLLLARLYWRIPGHDWIGALLLALAVFWYLRGLVRRYRQDPPRAMPATDPLPPAGQASTEREP